MRKALTLTAIVVGSWFVLDILRIPDLLLAFLLAGAIPGTNIVLSPSTTLAVLTALPLTLWFEKLARRNEAVGRFRHQLLTLPMHLNRLPRRLGRA